MNPTSDFLIIGGGVVGLTIALELGRRFPGASVTLLEKEDELGAHASGRNSGVLHAGFYYTADSLKARFTRDGNRRMREYCQHRGIPVRACGKLVVARSEQDHPGLDELLRRARSNDVELHAITTAEARELEPLARTAGRALWSPSTASVSPRLVMNALAEDARRAGVRLLTRTRYLGRSRDGGVSTSAGQLSPGFVVNAAGLQADRVARDFGFAARHRILPFKGLYLYGEALPLTRHVYPVPDIGMPFLGVHFTVTADGVAKIGPTAIPAFWREHYGGLHGFSARELVEIVARETMALLRDDFGFRALARAELAKYSRARLVHMAAELVPDAARGGFARWGPAGIRAQLYDTQTRTLDMDFRHEGDARSFHVLNAVSPAFTCALPFSEYLVSRIAELVA